MNTLPPRARDGAAKPGATDGPGPVWRGGVARCPQCGAETCVERAGDDRGGVRERRCLDCGWWADVEEDDGDLDDYRPGNPIAGLIAAVAMLALSAVCLAAAVGVLYLIVAWAA